MSSKNSDSSLTAATQEDEISRDMLVWLRTFADAPATINFEFLGEGVTGMALSTIQSTYITKRFITGGYQAEYQFKVLYRVPIGIGVDNGARLSAVELLNKLGDWARTETPELSSARAIKVEPATRADLFARYENGDEDYQILMKLIYEVI